MKKFILVLSVFITAVSYPQPVISFQTVTSGLTVPVDVANAKDGSNRLFIVEEPGRIRIVEGGALRADTFLNISSIVKFDGEQGLLSVAFHPNYAANGYFFVWYNNLQGNVTLARYSRSSLYKADPASSVVLMTIYKPYPNHNGADLNFGPDGYLYFGTGDGGNGGDPGNRAQNGDSLQGKMMRIDVNNPNPPYYSIPPTNPYITNAAVRDEIIAVGLRNPWRWSFDRQTGDMWIADVGEGLWEEVNFRAAGSILGLNYQWPCLEATHAYRAACGSQGIGTNVDAIFEYPHDNTIGGKSITGGFVYRGADFPSLQGYYITSDYISNHGWLIKPNGSGGWTTTMQAAWAATITSYGEDENGEIYAVSPGNGAAGNGSLYRVIASGATLPMHLTSFTGRLNGLYHELNWEVQNEEAGDIYIVEKRVNNAQPFTEVNRQTIKANSTANKYTTNVAATNEKTFYRLQIQSKDGRVQYSSVIAIESTNHSSIKAIVTGNTLQLLLPANANSIAVFDAAGKLVVQKQVANNVQLENISLQNFAKGVITIRVQLQDGLEVVRTVY